MTLELYSDLRGGSMQQLHPGNIVDCSDMACSNCMSSGIAVEAVVGALPRTPACSDRFR